MRTSGSKSGTTGMELLVSLSIPKFVRVGSQLLTNFGIGNTSGLAPIAVAQPCIQPPEHR